MKKIFGLLILNALMAFTPTAKMKVIFFGDSITQLGIQPKGYVSVVKELAAQDGQQENFEFVGAGIGGNKIYDLYLRLDDDVLAKNPDVVVIFVGVNDVWHKSSFGTGTDPDKFEKFYNAVINKLKAKNIKVILATPACIGERTDFSNQQDGDLNRYSNIIRSIAAKNNCQLVDLRKLFLDYNLKNNPENKESGILTTDRVHLNETGNKLVAEAMWSTIKQVK